MELDDLSGLRAPAESLVLEDVSNLREGGGVDASPEASLIKVPLNGEVYWAVRDPAAETIMSVMGSASGAGDLATEIQRLGVTGKSMEEVAADNPVLAVRLASIGLTQTERTIRFLQDVLLPESARRWAENMRAKPPAPPGAGDDWYPSDEEIEAHRRRTITMRQCLAVHQRLMAAYSGRPTVPPSSSQNGHGGTGGASTAGAPAEVSTP